MNRRSQLRTCSMSAALIAISGVPAVRGQIPNRCVDTSENAWLILAVSIALPAGFIFGRWRLIRLMEFTNPRLADEFRDSPFLRACAFILVPLVFAFAGVYIAARGEGPDPDCPNVDSAAVSAAPVGAT